jgi:hypothetical protein
MGQRAEDGRKSERRSVTLRIERAFLSRTAPLTRKRADFFRVFSHERT